MEHHQRSTASMTSAEFVGNFQDDSSSSSQEDHEDELPPSHFQTDSSVVRRRHRIKGASLDTLESFYNSNSRPSSRDIALLARIIDEPEQRVRIWFNNRRGKTVRERTIPERNASISDQLDQESEQLGGSLMIEVSGKGLIPLSDITSEDPLIMALKAKIIDLHGQLYKKSQKLPPISAIFQHKNPQIPSPANPTALVDYTVLRNSLHQLFTIISSTFHHKPKTTHCEIPLHLSTGGDQIEGILQANHIRVFCNNNSRRHYILTGSELMRLSQHAPMSAGSVQSGDCVVSLADQQLVKVNGVYVVPLSPSKSGGDRPVLLKASCTRIS